MPKISELPAGSAATGTESVPVVQNGATVKFTLAKVATTGAAADVGLGSVNNTSDANKPVSTAQAAADAIVAANASAGIAAEAVLARNASNLTSGTVPAAQLPTAPGVYRERLTADRTYYVRTDGSDSNTGLVNSSGGAFLTIGRAIAIVGQTLDLNGFNLTIQLGDGTYNESPALIPYLGRTSQGHIAPTAVVIQGNHVTPSNVVVNGGFTAVEAGYYEWILRDFKIVSGAANSVYADLGGWLVVDNLVFGTTTANHMEGSFGIVEIVSNYTIAGGAAQHIYSVNTGRVLYQVVTVTVSGTPAFSGAFANVASGGYLLVPVGLTFSGSATGTRWSFDPSAIIAGITSGYDSLFPGNANGAFIALPANRGGTGDLGTAWTAYTPAFNASTGTITTATATGRYKLIGKTVFFQATLAITTNGTGSGIIQLGIPFTSGPGANYPVVGYESAVTGKEIAGAIPGGNVLANCAFYDGTYPGANAYHVNIGGVYESA